ncbi:hypothetical protein Nocox_23850 [Nonomuraea coxensis DSM 45129]|uniref:DUF4097 domain-containing protein n=1 Tax=Nonomuraea coxensis DSM 45129 TaxID=1122611 RepID=A0ABX8U6S0_9ACTN|nr:DUF4097 family beta strand repeat-containing protein [Nonomuraea coxensis]QYC42373.1 hypothetical protein Nocox_23850 [Nonomuraea coxensis DSM 45129]
MKRTTLIAGVLALAATAAGCGIAGPAAQATSSYEVPGDVTGLRVEVDSGTVELVGADRRGVRVTERLTWRKHKPETSHEVRGGTLDLVHGCPATFGLGAIGGECEVSYRVEVPKGVRAEVGSDSGDLTLSGLSGEVRVSSDSGTIRAEGLAGGRVTATSDSGDVTLAFTAQPDQVTTENDSGRTVVRVPAGPYRVEAETDSGDKRITAAADASARRSIKVSSDSGDLEVLTP